MCFLHAFEMCAVFHYLGMDALILCLGVLALLLRFVCHGGSEVLVLSSNSIAAGTSLSDICRLCLVCQLSHC